MATLAEWQPIESAPRDGGEPFWVGAPGFIALAYWNVGLGAFCLVLRESTEVPMGLTPTHWQPSPLPDPPQ